MPLGVRSLTGALGSLQTRAGLGHGDVEALQDCSQTDLSFLCACVCITCRINSEAYLYK